MMLAVVMCWAVSDVVRPLSAQESEEASPTVTEVEVSNAAMNAVEDAEAGGGNIEEVSKLDLLLRKTFGPPLKRFHQPIDAWLGSLSMTVAMGCAFSLFLIATIWTWTLPREFVYRGAPDQKPWRDLRLWATLVVIPYVAVYILLGR